MHKRLMMALVAMALVVALAIPLATLAVPPGAGGTQAPAKAGKAGGGERHPVIRQAIRQLEHSKMELNKEAARDFEGHRAKAVEHIEQALAELRLALKADVK